ncbi:MAG: YhbY family RNA-binding protein [Candidatus Woesearchaeota archaeon]
MTRTLNEVRHGKADMILGKDGITENVVKDLKIRLKKHKVLKVKFLPSMIEGKDKKALASNLAMLTESKVVSLVGFTVVLETRK